MMEGGHTMNKVKGLTRTVGVISIFLAIFLLNAVAIEAAEECRVVQISGIGSPVSIRIDPETLSVSKGTCVVWINWARAVEVKVMFREGQKCAAATKAPAGFRMDAMNCLVTDYIPLGGTASLMFAEEGAYDYEVGAAFATPQRGRIIVKK
jgi:hypothetical protein